MNQANYETNVTITTSDGRVIELKGREGAYVLQAVEAVTDLIEMARPCDALISGLLGRRLHNNLCEVSIETEFKEYREYLAMRSDIVGHIAKHDPQALRDALKVA